jgi:hypothetical protein
VLELDGATLHFSFPEVHPDAVLRVKLERTHRVPEDGTVRDMPPKIDICGFVHIEDYGERVPMPWLQRGGVMTPLYSGEAVRLWFDSPEVQGYLTGWHFLVLVGVGKINAMTGEPLQDSPCFDTQDYVVAPDQYQLYGFCDTEGIVRQFTATPQGFGASIEEQLTGAGTYGGIQLVVYPMTREMFEVTFEKELISKRYSDMDVIMFSRRMDTSFNVGIGLGGLVRQLFRKDSYGRDAWNVQVKSRCFIHLVNASIWHRLTGEQPHRRPSIEPAPQPANQSPPKEVATGGQSGGTLLGRLKNLIPFPRTQTKKPRSESKVGTRGEEE